LWPFAAALELGQQGLKLVQDNLKFLAEAQAIATPPPPEWTSPNHVRLELDTMRLRDFSKNGRASSGLPVVIDAPYAGHSATIADYAKGQSLVQTLRSADLARVLVTDWKAATDEMRDFDIDKYLAEINVIVDDLGGAALLVGLCQGGWMAAMFAARFPRKVRALVLAGAPIDTHAGDGPLKTWCRNCRHLSTRNSFSSAADECSGKPCSPDRRMCIRANSTSENSSISMNMSRTSDT
jgi:pimeloyl-ACP methyl ester carboxylesterase